MRYKTSVKIKKVVRLGKMQEEIAAVALEEKIDLIVVDLRKRFLFSSLGKRRLLKAIDKLPYAVLLPPQVGEGTPGRGKRILAFHPILPNESTA